MKNESVTYVDLDSFLEDIKEPFCWSLYSSRIPAEWNNKELIYTGFPYCCELASQLVGSFLKAKYNEDTTCVGAIARHPLHYWCELQGLIVDFTDFQFGGMSAEVRKRFDDHSWTRKMFKSFIESIPAIYQPWQHTHKLDPTQCFEIVDLTAIREAEKYDFTRNGFLEFVKNNIGTIKTKSAIIRFSD